MKNKNLILTLDDGKQYIVMATIQLNQSEYYCLTARNDATQIMFCQKKDNTLIKVTDEVLLCQLIQKCFPTKN